MANAAEETQKRLKITAEFNDAVRKNAIGVILVGSVAYSPNSHVTAASDIDTLVIYKNANDCIDLYFKDKREKMHFADEQYDGLLVKRKINDVAVSIHNMSIDALNKIASTDYVDLVYYRQAAKDITYFSKDFDGVSHPFQVRSEPVPGLMGVKRLEPVAFERDNKFVFGNDMDKILSGGIILHDTNNIISDAVSVLWDHVARKMVAHFRKTGNDSQLANADLGDYLFRHDRFTPDVKEQIRAKTQQSISMVINV